MALGFAGWANMPDDQVAGTHFIAPELGLGNVHIVFTDAVAGRAQETDAFAHDLEDAAAHINTLLGGLLLADRQDQRFFFQAVGINHVEFPGDGAQFSQGFIFQF